MTDPEDLLRDLPEESPPPEIVLAALRVFRYRAIAAVALAIAIVVTGVMVKNHLDAQSRLRQRIATAEYTSGGVNTLGRLRNVDGVSVMYWELVTDGENRVFVHILAWDRSGRDFTIGIANATIDGQPAPLGDLESSGGGATLVTSDLWQEIRLPSLDDPETLSFEVQVDGLDSPISTSFHNRI
jgi:hypothetical protein